MNEYLNCIVDQQLIIQNTTNTTAFLTRTGILRESSEIGKCNNKWIEYNIQNKYLIRMKNGKSEVQPLDESSLYILQSHENVCAQQTYQHDSKFSKEADNLE